VARRGVRAGRGIGRRGRGRDLHPRGGAPRRRSPDRLCPEDPDAPPERLELASRTDLADRAPFVAEATRRAIEARDRFAARRFGRQQLVEELRGFLRFLGAIWSLEAARFPSAWPCTRIGHRAGGAPLAEIRDSASGCELLVGEENPRAWAQSTHTTGWSGPWNAADGLSPCGSSAQAQTGGVHARVVMNWGCRRYATWNVCSRPRGNSAQGLCDLAGNVGEWTGEVAPWGTTSVVPGARVLRGGSWYGVDPPFYRSPEARGPSILVANFRSRIAESWRSNATGFRPARPAAR
jgi:hypothetical protein